MLSEEQEIDLECLNWDMVWPYVLAVTIANLALVLYRKMIETKTNKDQAAERHLIAGLLLFVGSLLSGLAYIVYLQEYLRSQHTRKHFPESCYNAKVSMIFAPALSLLFNQRLYECCSRTPVREFYNLSENTVIGVPLLTDTPEARPTP